MVVPSLPVRGSLAPTARCPAHSSSPPAQRSPRFRYAGSVSLGEPPGTRLDGQREIPYRSIRLPAQQPAPRWRRCFLPEFPAKRLPPRAPTASRAGTFDAHGRLALDGTASPGPEHAHGETVGKPPREFSASVLRAWSLRQGVPSHYGWPPAA